MRAIQVYVSANPAQATAVLSLLAALSVNWLLGLAVAIRERLFSVQQLPRILASQFASTEIRVILGMLGTALVTAFTGEQAAAVLGADNRALAAMLVSLLFTTFAAASALYSVAIWHECALQLRSLITGATPPAPKQVAGSGLEMGPAG